MTDTAQQTGADWLDKLRKSLRAQGLDRTNPEVFKAFKRLQAERDDAVQIVDAKDQNADRLLALLRRAEARVAELEAVIQRVKTAMEAELTAADFIRLTAALDRLGQQEKGSE